MTGAACERTGPMAIATSCGARGVVAILGLAVFSSCLFFDYGWWAWAIAAVVQAVLLVLTLWAADRWIR